MDLIKKDKTFIGRDEAAIPIIVEKTHGSFIIDNRGKKYIDFLSGWCIGNIGWGNAEIRKKLSEYDGPEYVQPALIFKPWIELAELLATITPGDLTVCYRATGGTEAVEIALQAAMTYTKRYEFVSIAHSYHGHSIGAMSIGSADFREKYPHLSPKTHHLSAPFDDDAADKLEHFLKSEKIAALIMEPMVCNLGVEVPTDSFMKRAASLCKQYGTLLIMDEVMTGFMRTGKMFACEHYDLEPDMICMAKGLTSGYGAMGATIISEKIAHKIHDDFPFYSSFGWHPFAVQAALLNIHYLLAHKKALEKNIAEMHDYFVTRLAAINWPCNYKIRSKGLAMSIHLDDDKLPRKITDAAREAGVFTLLSFSNAIAFFPALTIDLETAKQGLDIVEKVVGEIA